MVSGRYLRFILHYGCAVVSVLVAFQFTRVFGTASVGVSPQFFAAVMISAWYGGLGPGIVATILSALITGYFIIEPTHSLAIVTDDLVRLIGFASVAILIGYLHNGTKRAHEAVQRAKEAADRANRAKDRFLAVLSHELRNPLNPALLAISALQRRTDLSPSVLRDLEMIRHNLELETRLIDDLLDISGIARGKLAMQPALIDAHEIISDALSICRADMESKQLDVSMQLHAQDHHLNADPTRLRQVVWNLLKNAVKFTPPRGRIYVRTDNPSNGMLQLKVTDTGIGITADVLPKIFNAFEQGGNTVTSQFGGLGLGLAISRSLVEAHGGMIRADSDGCGRGATFTIELPVAAAPVPQPPSAPANSPSTAEASKAHKILLVEDDADTSQLMARLLAGAGHRVTQAHDIAGALRATESARFDLLISDLGLPDGSGLELMRQLKRQYGICGIALSGHAAEEDSRKSHEAGFDVHLAKPVNIQQLNNAIDKLARQNCATADVR